MVCFFFYRGKTASWLSQNSTAGAVRAENWWWGRQKLGLWAGDLLRSLFSATDGQTSGLWVRARARRGRGERRAEAENENPSPLKYDLAKSRDLAGTSYASTCHVRTMKRIVAFVILMCHTAACFVPASPWRSSIGIGTTSSVARGEDIEVDNSTSESEDDGDKSEQYLRFSGVGRLYLSSPQESTDAHLRIVDKLAAATCAVVGVGGVGSWGAEALSRSGVGNIILVDMDEVCISNVNRQLHAITSSVGRSKIDEMKRRLLDINPNVNVTTIFDFVTLDNMDDIMNRLPADTICLDCIDGQREKAALIAACYEKKIPVVTCGGAAGRKVPTKIVCGDLTTAQEDRLLFSCRKILRKEYGWPKGPGQGEKNRHKFRPWNIPAVFSTEIQKSVQNMHGESSLRRCDGALGTACFVTGTYGFVAASCVVQMIVDDDRLLPEKPAR